MKRTGLLALLLATNSVHALNIVEGWYGGILLGLNYTPTTNFLFPTTFIPPNTPVASVITPLVPITLSYGLLGQIAGQTGYRCGKYRVEGQIGYNSSPYSSLKINNITVFKSSGGQYYKFQGATDTASGMINGYYDFLPTDPESNFAPFVGLGIGYAHIQNTIKMDFWYDKSLITGATITGYQVGALNTKRTTTTPAGQVMIGASYFLDDLSAFALDLRYFTTQKITEVSSKRMELVTVNLTFNGAFNFG